MPTAAVRVIEVLTLLFGTALVAVSLTVLADPAYGAVFDLLSPLVALVGPLVPLLVAALAMLVPAPLRTWPSALAGSVAIGIGVVLVPLVPALRMSVLPPLVILAGAGVLLAGMLTLAAATSRATSGISAATIAIALLAAPVHNALSLAGQDGPVELLPSPLLVGIVVALVATGTIIGLLDRHPVHHDEQRVQLRGIMATGSLVLAPLVIVVVGVSSLAITQAPAQLGLTITAGIALAAGVAFAVAATRIARRIGGRPAGRLIIVSAAIGPLFFTVIGGTWTYGTDVLVGALVAVLVAVAATLAGILSWRAVDARWAVDALSLLVTAVAAGGLALGAETRSAVPIALGFALMSGGAAGALSAGLARVGSTSAVLGIAVLLTSTALVGLVQFSTLAAYSEPPNAVAVLLPVMSVAVIVIPFAGGIVLLMEKPRDER